jgi:tetratricopeptide (TPR) repeat protein
MKKLKYTALISGLVFFSCQPAMAGWLDALKGPKKVSPEEIELEPEKYCLEFYQEMRLSSAARPCSLAAKNDPSFYYYVAMINYLRGFANTNAEYINDFKLAKQALEKKQDVESKQKLARVYFAMATIYEKHAPDARWVNVAKENYEKALALAEETNEKTIRAFALVHLGGYYVNKSDLEKAEMYLQKAEKAFEEVKETYEFNKNWVARMKERLYGYLGILAFKKKNYAEAEENFKKVLDIIRRHFYDELHEYWAWYGDWLNQMGKHDEAEKYIKKAINTVEMEFKKQEQQRFGWQPPLNKLKDLATWYENLAEVYIKKNEYEQARKSLMKANMILRKVESRLYDYERKWEPMGLHKEYAAERLEIERKIKQNEKRIEELKANGNK